MISADPNIKKMISVTSSGSEEQLVNNNNNNIQSCSNSNEDVKLLIKSDNGVDAIYPQSAIKNNSDSQTVSKNIRNVSFDQIHIREYFIELGDNPSCSRGPPLTIGWDYDDIGSVELEEFEEYRPSRRCGSQMMVPFDVRQEMLEQIGYSPLHIRAVVQECNAARYQRRKTAKSKSDKVDEVVESANRKLKKLFTRKRE